MMRRALGGSIGGTAVLAIALAALSGCAGRDRPASSTASPSIATGPTSSGFSGLARIDGDRFLVVHDTKSQHDGPRLGLVEVAEAAGVAYRPLAVEGWPEPWGRSNDLEGVCALPGRPGEFLAVEASFWRGRPRRILHFVLDEAGAEVAGAVVLPPAGPDPESDGAIYYEGIACAAAGEGFLVVLGQYGGGGPPRLRWGTYEGGALDFDGEGLEGVPIAVPGEWTSPPRGIGDLHLEGGTLWAAASADPGDRGPFRSVVYETARIDPAASPPVQPIERPEVRWTVDGFKIEALAAPAPSVPGSVLSFGTEDEAYGGVWRPLGTRAPRRSSPPTS